MRLIGSSLSVETTFRAMIAGYARVLHGREHSTVAKIQYRWEIFWVLSVTVSHFLSVKTHLKGQADVILSRNLEKPVKPVSTSTTGDGAEDEMND